MTTRLFCLSNLASSRVEPGLPWEYRNGSMPQGMTKDDFRAWCAKGTTESLFFSGFEGANAALRVSESNPPASICALVADYDAAISDEELKAFMSRARTDYPPNFIGRTFSGGVRLIWLFEGPIPVYARKLTEAFLKKLARELKLKKLFPGLDEDALLRPAQYYHAGHDWMPLYAQPLSLDLLQSWLMGVSDKADWAALGEEVPIERVAEAVEARFPGRWQGPFQLGARGCRFWDETADNDTAAIIRTSGMQCFTGPKPFVSWREILGPKFVDQYRADTIGAAIAGVWHDGRDYWREVNSVWRLYKKPDIALYLRVQRGMSDERRKGQNASELDRVLNQIHQTKSVDGAAPFVFIREPVVWHGARRFLNIARSQIMVPAEQPQRWGQQFPWIAKFLADFFDPDEQLNYFLSWLAYAYQKAYAGKPRNGQVIFLAGEVNQGKTLISNKLVGTLFGGHMDASDYLLGETKFNKELFEVGLWCVDDTLPSSDPRKQRLYSAMLKKIPANYSFQYHAKFRDQLMLPWAGRVIVTCNADAESIRILPDTEMSLMDKICLFKVRTAERDFSKAGEQIEAELPFFARFLLDYQIPEECQGEARFGVACYHHEDLLEEARQSSRTGAFLELLEMFKRSFFSNASKTEWQGSATDLLSQMMADESTKSIAANYSPEQVGRRLSQLQAQGYPLDYSRERSLSRTRIWRIQKADASNQPF